MSSTTTYVLTAAQAPKIKQPIKEKKWNIYWPNALILITIHLIAVYSWIYIRPSLSWKTRLFDKSYRVLGAIGVTGGCHRLWSHRAFKASVPGQILFMILASTMYVNSIFVFSMDHRLHHKYVDTNADPHNSKRGFFFSHVGWLMVRKHEDVKKAKKTIDMSDLTSSPVVMFQHRYYYYLVSLFCFIVPTLIPWYYFNENMLDVFMASTIFYYIIGLNLIWCVNSVNHIIGSKPYDSAISSTDNCVTFVTAFGEGYHNYHHTFPWDYTAAEIKNLDFFNTTTIFINLVAKLGLVTHRKQVPPALLEKRMKKTGTTVPVKFGDKRTLGIKNSYIYSIANFFIFMYAFLIIF